MGNAIFFSWQSDRPTLTGRNFIERALKDALKRISADATVQDAPRGELLVDRDTLNVPGSPPIFETILTKIEEAVIFVPDLTFVGVRESGRPMPNPNVLIEYGYALSQHGHPRIIAIMNAAYGEPKPENMPFNLGHIKFPICYRLQPGAGEEERKNVRSILSKDLESAIKLVFESEGFTAAEETTTQRPRTVLDEAADYARQLEYEAALSALGQGNGLEMVRANVRKLFALIEEQCAAIHARTDIEFEFGAKAWSERDVENFCTVRAQGYSMQVLWGQPYAGTSRDASLFVAYFKGNLILPTEAGTRMYLDEPQRLNRERFVPHLSPYSDIGWIKQGLSMREAEFISNSDLASSSLTELIQLLKRDGDRHG